MCDSLRLFYPSCFFPSGFHAHIFRASVITYKRSMHSTRSSFLNWSSKRRANIADHLLRKFMSLFFTIHVWFRVNFHHFLARNFIAKKADLFTPWCRVLFEQLTGLQLVKKFPALPHSQASATCLYPEPAQSIPCTHNSPPGDTS